MVLENAGTADARPTPLTSKQNIADSTPVKQNSSTEEILTTCNMYLLQKPVLIKGISNATTKVIMQ